MTDAELWGLIVEYNSTMLSTFALFLTLVSGFLVVAYLVGDKLTQWQAAIVTSGFVLSTALFAATAYGYGTRALYLIAETSEQYRSGVMFSSSALWLYVCLYILGILACLKFMWDVRHPKPK